MFEVDLRVEKLEWDWAIGTVTFLFDDPRVSVQALFAGIRSVGLTAVGLALERLS